MFGTHRMRTVTVKSQGRTVDVRELDETVAFNFAREKRAQGYFVIVE